MDSSTFSAFAATPLSQTLGISRGRVERRMSAAMSSERDRETRGGLIAAFTSRPRVLVFERPYLLQYSPSEPP